MSPPFDLQRFVDAQEAVYGDARAELKAGRKTADPGGPRAVFELFVHRLPKTRRFLLAAGLEQALDYLERFRFAPDDLEFSMTDPAHLR